jgi:ribonuclease I
MRTLILALLLISIYSFNLRKAKQSYDSYVMAVQWSNGYCQVNSCGDRAAHVETNTLTIHGLWPSLKNGKRLNPCTSGVKIKDDGSELFKRMKQYWPSFSNKGNEAFWEHEYNKHGFCMVEEYGWEGYEQYFDFTLDLFLKDYKDLIIEAFPETQDTTLQVSYDDMKKKIKGIIPNATFQMNCKSGYLTEFYFYLLKDYTPSTSSKFNNQCKSGKVIFK